MRIILFVTSILITLTISDHSYAEVMKFPNGAVINKGGQLEVVVEVENDEAVSAVLLQAQYYDNNLDTGKDNVILHKAPYRHVFIADKDHSGEMYVSSEVVYKDKTRMSDKLIQKIIIRLPEEIKLTKIGLVNDNHVAFDNEIIFDGLKYHIEPKFYGLFSDGRQRYLSEGGYSITLSSDDTSVVDTFLEKNQLVALKEGKTKIRILVDNTETTVDAKVEIKIFPPTRLKAKVVDKSVRLNWEPPINESYVTSYKIFRRQSHTVYFLDEIPKGSITYIDKTAVTGEYYDYIVKAVSRILDKQSDDYVSIMVK